MVTTEANLKKIHRRKREKTSIYFFTLMSQKIKKTHVVQALRGSLYVRMRTVAENLCLSLEVHVES